MNVERLNAERKRDLAAHYEKEKRLLGTRPAAGGDAAAKPRKPSSVKFTDAYSRDPNKLFVQETDSGLHQPLPAPMNDNYKTQNNKGQVELNPVKYKNVRLKQPLGPFAEGDSFAVATVENYRGQVMLYKTETDFLNGEASFADKEFRVPSKRRFNNRFYIHELLAFLQRGHSLLEPTCRCKHEIDTERASELGISMPRVRKGHPEDRSSIRDDKCQLSTKRTARTSQELSFEIAVGDIHETKDAKTDEYLVDALKRNPKIIFDDSSGKDLWCFKAEGASNINELLHLVREHPLGYKVPEEKDAYNGVQADVEALAENKDVYRIENKETKVAVMFPRNKDLQLEVDDDIRQLWKDCWQKPKSQELKDELKEEGIAPTKQEARAKETGKRKGQGRQRRTSKKSSNDDYLRRPLGLGS